MTGGASPRRRGDSAAAKPKPCPAKLSINGEHFPCDWPTNANGKHEGWAHASKAAQAIWCGNEGAAAAQAIWQGRA